jgi:hypothetical protein
VSEGLVNRKLKSALCGVESATFFYDASVLKLIGGLHTFPPHVEQLVEQVDSTEVKVEEKDTEVNLEVNTLPKVEVARTFRRAPVLALFESAGGDPVSHRLAGIHGCIAVLSVHLKSYDNCLALTKAEARGLAEHVVPWMEKWIRSAGKADGVHTYVILGDFNLAEMGDDGKIDRATFGGDAWQGLKDQGFQLLLEPGEPTNFGPPITLQDKCLRQYFIQAHSA